MKNRIIFAVMAAVVGIGLYAIGTTQAKAVTEIEIQEVEKIIEVIPDEYVDTQSQEFINNYIDMRQVVDFATTENGFYLYTKDGNGYYWER